MAAMDTGTPMLAEQIEVGDFVAIAERNGRYWIEVIGVTVCDEESPGRGENATAPWAANGEVTCGVNPCDDRRYMTIVK